MYHQFNLLRNGEDYVSHVEYRVDRHSLTGSSQAASGAALLLICFNVVVEEPLTGIHLHRAVMMNDVMGVERILETG